MTALASLLVIGLILREPPEANKPLAH